MTIHFSSILILIVSALVATAGFLWIRKPAKAGAASKNKIWTRTAGSLLMILGVWVFAVRFLRLVSGAGKTSLLSSVLSYHTRIFGVRISSTILIGWGILGCLILLAILARLLVAPRMREVPHGVQTFLEMVVSLLDAIGYVLLFPARAVGAISKRSAARKLAAASRKEQALAEPAKAPKAPKPLGTAVSVLLIVVFWAIVRILLSFVPRTPHPSFWAMRSQLFGYSVSNTVLASLAVLGILILLAILGRLLVVPGMRDMRKTRGAETAVDFTATLIYGVEWVLTFPARARAAARSRAAARELAVAEKTQPEPAGTKASRWTFSGFVQFITKDPKGQRLVKLFKYAALILILWVVVISILSRLFGSSRGGEFTVSIWPERIPIWNIDISSTVLLVWVVMAGLLILALLARIFVIPRMQDNPRGIQNALEAAVDGIALYTKDKTHGIGDNLGAYIFTITALLIGSAIVELFGLRPPTTDITFTFALAIITFILINFYGLRRKGFFGRVKNLSEPYPFVLPIRIITDLAIPVSLSCRLFGNMLGGMIVVDLIYNALGNGAVGIPSVLGLFFNVFHPLIQAFIFITLSLTFINEAVE